MRYNFNIYKILSVFFLLIFCPELFSQNKSIIDLESCSYKGKLLYGRIKFEESFPDIKVMVVDSFPDLKVKIVESFPDIKIKFVGYFPGIY